MYTYDPQKNRFKYFLRKNIAYETILLERIREKFGIFSDEYKTKLSQLEALKSKKLK